MALLVKLRPRGPWRAGSDSGDRLRAGRILHSDALYSALTHAFIELGEFDAWLDATASHADGSQVRLTSCFPFIATEGGDTLFLPPPETHWPPADSLRIRWKSALYVPPTAIWQLLNDKPLIEEHWVVDGVSECLLPVIRNIPAQSPFRVTIRSRAAVDRLGQGIETHRTACLEFSKGSGIWTAFTFAGKAAEERWSAALQGALKLIADSGLGGERSSGWGRFDQPEFIEGEIGQLLFGDRYRAPEETTGHWLLSLFSPAADDTVDWKQGNYRVVARTGRVESRAGWGEAKRANNMIAEGSVLVAAGTLKGMARDVAPEGFPHPVYRAGFAFTLPIGKSKPPRPPKPAPVVKETVPAVVVDSALLEALASDPGKPIEPAQVADEAHLGPVSRPEQATPDASEPEQEPASPASHESFAQTDSSVHEAEPSYRFRSENPTEPHHESSSEAVPAIPHAEPVRMVPATAPDEIQTEPSSDLEPAAAPAEPEPEPTRDRHHSSDPVKHEDHSETPAKEAE